MNIIYSEWNRWKRMMETEHKQNKTIQRFIWNHLKPSRTHRCWLLASHGWIPKKQPKRHHAAQIHRGRDWRIGGLWGFGENSIPEYTKHYIIYHKHTHTHIYIIFIYTSIHQLISYVQYMSRKILQLHWHRQAIGFFYCVQDGGISEQKWWTRAVKSRNVNVRSFLLRLMPRKVSVVSKLQCIVCICHLVLCCAFPSLEVYWAHEGPLSLCLDPGAGILWDGFWMIPAVNVSVPR